MCCLSELIFILVTDSQCHSSEVQSVKECRKGCEKTHKKTKSQQEPVIAEAAGRGHEVREVVALCI